MREKNPNTEVSSKKTNPSKPKIKQKALGSIHILLKLSNLILFSCLYFSKLGNPRSLSPFPHLPFSPPVWQTQTWSCFHKGQQATAISLATPPTPYFSGSIWQWWPHFSFFTFFPPGAFTANSPASLGLSPVNSSLLCFNQQLFSLLHHPINQGCPINIYWINIHKTYHQ